ncbi:prepilin-type N-terminal cleavage/methylation domain-containing protein [Frateuria defendens]|uniref:prepilin-type N-terminal cleavage/methylation domain-containing protein n=1 Tax=Frateuria defendens TaxID=2219559 RepID=UPI000B316546|nr:prepilin-type N-terminal cleavage/methylation domain-containing protein [Frateuria defendens]
MSREWGIGNGESVQAADVARCPVIGAVCRVPTRCRNAATDSPFPIPHSRRANGFSLFEVLGALALLALLLLGVYGGLRTATHAVRNGSATIERLDRIRSAQQFLRRELAQAMAQPIGRDREGDSLYFKGDAHEMRFVAPLPGYLGKLGPQLQTLSLVDDGHGAQRLEIGFATLPTASRPSTPLGKPEVLLEGVRNARFSYRGRNLRGEVQPWGDWPDGRLLPALVRIELEPGGTARWPRFDAPLRVDASANQMQLGLLRGPGGMP